MKRVIAFDAARGVAVLLVVLLHTSMLPISDVPDTQSIARMALLLLISGLLSHSLLTAPPDKARTRSMDLMWLALVWLPITAAATHRTLSLPALAMELVAPTTHLWYIELLALLSLSVPLLRGRAPWLALVPAAVAAGLHSAGFRTGVAGWDQSLHFTVFFYLGLYGKPHIERTLAFCNPAVGVVAAGAALALAVAPVPHSIITISAAGLLLVLCQSFGYTMFARGLAWLGRRTADVYLPHVAVLGIAGPVLAATVGRMGWLGTTLTVVAVTGICLGLRRVADRLGCTWLYERPVQSAMQRAVN